MRLLACRLPHNLAAVAGREVAAAPAAAAGEAVRAVAAVVSKAWEVEAVADWAVVAVVAVSLVCRQNKRRSSICPWSALIMACAIHRLQRRIRWCQQNQSSTGQPLLSCLRHLGMASSSTEPHRRLPGI